MRNGVLNGLRRSFCDRKEGSFMTLCIHCKTEETELYENGAPTCLKCAEAPKRKPAATQQEIRNALLHNVLEATAQHNDTVKYGILFLLRIEVPPLNS